MDIGRSAGSRSPNPAAGVDQVGGRVGPRPRWAPRTITVAAGRPERRPDAPVTPPIVLTSTYVGQGIPQAGTRGYGRVSNPTWEAFEDVLGRLEGGQSLLFGSGMAALSAALTLLEPGGTLVVPISPYSLTAAMATEAERTGRLRVRTVDIADTEAVAAVLGDLPGAPGRALLWVETPTNPLLSVADLPALVAAAHDRGALVVSDNTFATPLGQRPLEAGADVVVHSVTKYLAGHSDVVLGATVTRDPVLLERLHAHRTLHGAIPGTFEAWLALRGLRTLSVRFERSQANAAELARRLAQHAALSRVRHPSLPHDPGHARAARQMSGFGSIISVEVAGGVAAADLFVDRVRLWLPATSLGGVESTLERRRRFAVEPAAVPENLVRLSVGIEDVEDLWADLEQALGSLGPAEG